MRASPWVRCPVVLLLLLDQAKAEEIRIDLGGPRQVQAVLSVSESAYSVSVKMLPVHSFDSGTNAELNREKARLLALQALAKHLSGKAEVQLVVSGAQVIKTGVDGKFYALTLQVPRGGVKVEQVGAKKPDTDLPKTTADRILGASALLTRKQDQLDTLHTLVAEWSKALKTTNTMKKDQDFYTSIAELEERGKRNLEELAKDITSDLLLLQIEKDELVQKIEEQKRYMLAALKTSVTQYEAAKDKLDK